MLKTCATILCMVRAFCWAPCSCLCCVVEPNPRFGTLPIPQWFRPLPSCRSFWQKPNVWDAFFWQLIQMDVLSKKLSKHPNDFPMIRHISNVWCSFKLVARQFVPYSVFMWLSGTIVMIRCDFVICIPGIHWTTSVIIYTATTGCYPRCRCHGCIVVFATPFCLNVFGGGLGV